jgi:hypothetical protein
MSQPVPPDLAKLRIDRSMAPIASRRRRWLWVGALATIATAGGLWYASQPRV